MVDVLNTILQGLLPCRIVSDDFVAGSTNWRVKKYADGFCEIEGSKYFEGLALSSFVTGGVWVGDLELALPFSLKSLIGAWADGVVGYGKKVHCAATADSVKVRIEGFQQENASGTVSIRVTGRWK